MANRQLSTTRPIPLFQQSLSAGAWASRLDDACCRYSSSSTGCLRRNDVVAPERRASGRSGDALVAGSAGPEGFGAMIGPHPYVGARERLAARAPRTLPATGTSPLRPADRSVSNGIVAATSAWYDRLMSGKSPNNTIDLVMHLYWPKMKAPSDLLSDKDHGSHRCGHGEVTFDSIDFTSEPNNSQTKATLLPQGRNHCIP